MLDRQALHDRNISRATEDIPVFFMAGYTLTVWVVDECPIDVKLYLVFIIVAGQLLPRERRIVTGSRGSLADGIVGITEEDGP